MALTSTRNAPCTAGFARHAVSANGGLTQPLEDMMVSLLLSTWLLGPSLTASAPLVAAMEEPPPAANPDTLGSNPFDVGGSNHQRKSKSRTTALDDLGVRGRYFPIWFPGDLDPQLEAFKWTYLLGGIIVPSSAVWSPYFMVKPHPEVDVPEFVKNVLVRLIILVGGHVAIYGGYLLLGLTCPPFLGFYLWGIPMYVASFAWLVLGYFQSQLTMLVTWNAMLKDQGIASTNRNKPTDDEDE